MKGYLIAILIVLAVVAASLFWPVAAPTVNDPVSDEEAAADGDGGVEPTIAWVKFDSFFKGTGPTGEGVAEPDDFSFVETKVSKGKYVDKAATQSVWDLMAQSLKWGNYQWVIDYEVIGPKTHLNWTTEEWQADLPAGKTTTLNWGSEVLYLSQAGTYTVKASLRAVAYGLERLDEPVLVTGEATFDIPASWK